MRHHSLMILGAIALSGAFAGSASAQNANTYVSSAGTNNANCTISSPCATFQQAHDATLAGGSVYALNQVFDTQALEITKGISFYSVNGDTAGRSFITVTTGEAVTVNAPSNATVTFVNFGFDGSGTANNGILFKSGNELQVYGGVIRRFNAAAPNGFGIAFQPTTVSKLLVQEPNIIGNGATSTGGGIQISPRGSSGGAQVLLSRVRSQLNAFGFAIDTTNSSNGVNAVIQGGQFHYNRQDGIIVVGGAPIGLLVKDADVFANGANGVRAIGANVTARLYASGIAGNGTGVASVSGGAVVSYGNNAIDANGTNGTPALIPQK